MFSSRLCHEQMAAARKVGVWIVGVMETDDRHGKPDFGLEKSRARTGGEGGGPVHETHTEMNLQLLDKVCFVPLRRQEHEIQAMLAETVRQLKSAPRLSVPDTLSEGIPPLTSTCQPEPEPEPEPNGA